VITSLVLTLFLGIGSILAGNDKRLPSQKLFLRTDGCYTNDTDPFFNLTIPRHNTEWKDIELEGADNLYAMSYLWQPIVPIVGTVVFGFIFSIIINMLRKTEPTPVKTRFMTPIMVSMWVKLLGKEKLSRWMQFEDDERDAVDTKKETYGLGSIPRATLNVSSSVDASKLAYIHLIIYYSISCVFQNRKTLYAYDNPGAMLEKTDDQTSFENNNGKFPPMWKDSQRNSNPDDDQPY